MCSGQDCKITSEVLEFFEKDNATKPIVDDRNIICKFTFTLPDSGAKLEETKPQKDEDGDYLVQRKGCEKLIEKVIKLEQRTFSNLNLVGEQLWRAALVLADFIIHSRNFFSGQTVLELGTGVGLTSIVAGMFAKQIICTDLDVGNILKLIETNLKRNKDLIKAQTFVHSLDFFNTNWSSELERKIKETTVVLAADVIYDNDVTEAFIKTIIKILSIPPKKTLYLALEKRYVFTISDMDSVAPCYEHLMSCLRSARSKPPFSEWTMTEVTLDFPQYFNYERTKQLIMFKITT